MTIARFPPGPPMNHAHPTIIDAARTLVETKPADVGADEPPRSRAALDEIFISPRLIDSVAFREYAQQLRVLIDDAEHTAQTLREGVIEAVTTRRELDRARHEQVERLQAAGKVLRALAAVTKTAPPTPATPAAPATLTESAPIPVPPSRSPPTAPVARSESPDNATDAIDRAIAVAERRLSLAVQTAEREIERRSAAAIQAIEERSLAIEARLDALERAEHAAADAATRAESAASKLSEQGRALAALHERVTQAVATLESAPAPSPPSRTEHKVTDGIAVSAESIERVAGSARDLTSLIDQSERVRRDVSAFLLESSSMLDELHARRKSLAGAVRDAVLACEKAEAIARRTRGNASES